MNGPMFTVHCKVKKHQNIVRLLQKTINKKHGLKYLHTVNDINDHIFVVSNTHGSSVKHLLNRPRPSFAGIY